MQVRVLLARRGWEGKVGSIPAMLLHFVVIPRLPRKELERKDIVDRHGRVVGVEQRES